MPAPSGCVLKKTVNLRQSMLQFITDYWMDHDKAPSLEEVGEQVSMSVPLVHYHLSRMREEGLVDWRYGKHRTLEVL